MSEKALRLLGLAKKGGNLITGEEMVAAACQRGKVRLIAVSADASANAMRRASGWSEAYEIPMLKTAVSKEELGAALGKNVCVFVGVTERKLAAAFVRALPDSAQHDALLAQLERRPGRRYQEKKQLEVAE